MNLKVFHQSSFSRWPLEHKSVQVILTSPPYYSLRKYNIPDVVIGGDTECEHEFIFSKNKLLNLQAGNPEYKRQWREDATQTINHGGFCIHCNAWKGQYGLEPTYQLYIEHTLLWCQEAWRVLRDDGVFFLNLGNSYPGSKCLLDIPARVSIALVDTQGWIKRNNIVWFKPNAMPESCADRFSKKHEMIYMFVKNPKYYFDLDAVREKITYDNDNRGRFSKHGLNANPDRETYNINPLGKNPGDVWKIATQPSPEKHYAMWPEKLVERMIRCSTKTGDIACDPFCGSNTTGRVAIKLQREFVGIDIGYADMQKRRTSNIQIDLMP